MVTVGVDPGSRWCAMVVRDGDELLDSRLLENEPDGRLAAWIDRCVKAFDALDAASARLVGVEQTVSPSSHVNGRRQLIDPGPLLVQAQLAGAIYGHARLAGWGQGWRVVWVPPARHGDAAIPAGTPRAAARRILVQLYPAGLIGPAETTGAGKSPMQHLRAAWDIAGAAPAAARIEEAACR